MSIEEARTRVAALKDEGNVALKSGDLAQAAELYQQATAEAALLPPEELASVWSNLALALFKQGCAAESIVAADKCIAAKPEWHTAHYRRGDALFYLQRYTEAQAAYAQAQALAAEDREVAAALALTAEAVQGGVWFRQLRPGSEFAVQAASPREELIFGAVSWSPEPGAAPASRGGRLIPPWRLRARRRGRCRTTSTSSAAPPRASATRSTRAGTRWASRAMPSGTR